MFAQKSSKVGNFFPPKNRLYINVYLLYNKSMNKRIIIGFVIGFAVTTLTGSLLLAIIVATIAGLFIGNN